MTKIKIYRNESAIVGFECSGHTGYSESGSDIVCAGVSSITLTALLGLKEVAKAKVSVKRNDEKGYFQVMLQSNDKISHEKAQVVFETMICGLHELAENYKKYIKLEE